MFNDCFKEQWQEFLEIKNSQTMKMMKQIYGMKTLADFEHIEDMPFRIFDEWYSYLINDFIPSQGKEDMDVFIILKFNPYTYILWKLAKAGRLGEELNKRILEKIEKYKEGNKR